MHIRSMKTVLYSYSATGNSLTYARQIAQELGDTQVLPLAQFRKGTKPESERVGILFPIYAWGPPRTVDEFLQNVDLSGAKYVFAVASCGGTSGNTLHRIRKALRRKGSDLQAGFVVASKGYLNLSKPGVKKSPQEKMVEMVRKLSGPRPKTDQERLPEIVATLRAGEGIKPERGKLWGSLLGSFFHDMATPMLAKSDGGYSVTDACTGCRTCARVCPRENIGLATGRPVWNHDCDSCGACAAWCPETAILTAGNLSATRQHHPGVSLQDFLLR
jgi:ferredoxin